MHTTTLRRSALALALLAGATLAACASAPRQDAGDTDPGSPFATVIIHNDAARIVTVFAVRQGTRMRLGTVAGVSEREFPLRRSMLDGAGELRLMVDLLGSSRQYYSDSIYVQEGDVVELRVSNLIG